MSIMLSITLAQLLFQIVDAAKMCLQGKLVELVCSRVSRLYHLFCGYISTFMQDMCYGGGGCHKLVCALC